ncbi:hypothetical protein B0A52_04513 [Exophiala mesophila]|uniref:WSC domain-containing protein n=1 Tax=Exophiala mesophila TaxID=212818 RepID=A0A438N9P6_EXOME|nr:hypothetical protein B0A52_04513 [Exophiala mesophila]
MYSTHGVRSTWAICATISLFLSNHGSAQNFVPTTPSSTFPACAVSCTVLLQAQTLCLPPNVAAAANINYEMCFCGSNLLTALYSTPDAICAAECQAPNDRVLLQTWYRSFCSSVGQGIDPVSTAPAPTATQSVVVVTVTSTSSSPGSLATEGATAGRPAPASNQSWIQGHWKWILMVAILIVGLGLLAWLLIWLKRRHRRKVDERRAAASGFPTAAEKREGAQSATRELWGPHQHMNYTHGIDGPDTERVVGSGARAARDKRHRRRSRSKRHRESRDPSQTSHNRPSASRRESSRGKARAAESTEPVASDIDLAGRDRSRSHPRRNPNSDIERGPNSDHQRRLREVRGARRNHDPP